MNIRGYDVLMMLGTFYYLCAFLHMRQVLDKIDHGCGLFMISMTVSSVLGFFEHVLKQRLAPDHGLYQFVIAMRKLSEFVGILAMAYLSWLGLTWTYHRFF